MNPERLKFIRELEKKDHYEILDLQDAAAMGIVEHGANFKQHQGVMIGTDGLGFQRDELGRLVKFPHFKGVEIGNDVEIRTGTVIARGTLSDTKIGDGCKIGSNVTIGHSAVIGKHCLICPNVVISGGVEIGDYSTISTGAVIHQGLKLKDHSVVGVMQYVKSNDFVLKRDF